MKINKTQNGTELTVALDGRLDTTTAPQLEAELQDQDDLEGSIIFIDDSEKGTGSVTIGTAGMTKISASDIKLMGKDEISHSEMYASSNLMDPVDVKPGEEIPVAVRYMGEDGLLALSPDEVEEYYASREESEVENEWTVLVTVTFQQ
ncbi:MAG: hypothetical protein IJV66_04795 [Firmicutes bacterium]|nr:hypothetical protein [Bacillota bacterium]